MIKYSPVDVARQYLYVREVTQNTGQRVEAIQHWCGGSTGQSWCCYFVTMILDICYQGASPISRMGLVQSVYNIAIRNKWTTTTPKIGDLFIYVDNNNHGHHIGIVTVDGGRVGIAGNTSADGTSSNGDRVAEHELISNQKLIVYINYPRDY